jgi:glutamate 5-kinase
MSMTDAKRIVVKVGTTTLTYPSGRFNIRRIDALVRVLSDVRNSGREVVLVTSGAIAVGSSRLKLAERPRETSLRQASAAVGQLELMYLYDKLFTSYGHVVAQILMTRIITSHDDTRKNLINTFNTLLSLGAIPIVNENDSVAVDELESEGSMAFGDNDQLSAEVASLIDAQGLILLSDIEGLYDRDPHGPGSAKLIPVVKNIGEDLFLLAGGAGSKLGTGGMVTKLKAAQTATSAGIDMIIMDGSHPEKIYDVFEGKPVGTYFPAK